MRGRRSDNQMSSVVESGIFVRQHALVESGAERGYGTRIWASHTRATRS